MRVRVRVSVRVSLEDDRRQLGRVRAGLDYYYYYYCAPARSLLLLLLLVLDCYYRAPARS